MAVFTAASDETGTHDGKGNFFCGGFVAPTNDWIDHFSPAWEERVLNGKPPIPYLHMTSIRSRAWRAKHGITEHEGERRVAEACRVINSMGSLFLVSTSLNEGHFRKLFKTFGIIADTPQPGVRAMVPDMISFFGFMTVALQYGSQVGAEKVDFVVERKDGATTVLLEMHSRMHKAYIAFGRQDLADLMGELIPAGKERVPLQAADVACWHIQRQDQGLIDNMVDFKRMRQIGSRHGFNLNWLDEWTDRMAVNAERDKVPSPFKPKPKRKAG